MIQGVLTFDDLRTVSGLGENARRATVERWADECGIKYKPDGNGGIWTTLRAMNASLGLTSNDAANGDKYDPEEVL